jgi:branched-chain amino acid transport system permease protein
MKDSEAACATLGLNLLGTKLLVFSVSAGIAGLGGALYAMQLTSIQPGNFDLVSSLQVFALSVVGGIGAVGGALFGAFSLFVFLPLLVALQPDVVRWVGLLPGLTGIGLGRNPNGAVHDMREGFLPLLQYPPALYGMVVAMVAIYVMRITDVITNWPFIVLMGAALVGATLVASLLRPKAVEEAAGDIEAVEDVPLEWRGIDRPWTDADLEELDRAIGLEGVSVHGSA